MRRPPASGRIARRLRVRPLPPAFKDHFSDKSAGYARYRPQYPAGLFEAIRRYASEPAVALDVATGSGQLALDLADFCKRVIATDASAEQIANAMPASRVEYRVAPAEASGLPDHSVELLTVGQALHWFDIERFGQEAERVIKPGGLLIAVSYAVSSVSADIDTVVDRLYTDLLDPFWPPERALVESRYAGIPLPGEPIDVGSLAMEAAWSVDDMLGYLRTWSASKRYERQHGVDPVGEIESDLRRHWGPTVRNVTWPLTIRASRL